MVALAAGTVDSVRVLCGVINGPGVLAVVDLVGRSGRRRRTDGLLPRTGLEPGLSEVAVKTVAAELRMYDWLG